MQNYITYTVTVFDSDGFLVEEEEFDGDFNPLTLESSDEHARRYARTMEAQGYEVEMREMFV